MKNLYLAAKIVAGSVHVPVLKGGRNRYYTTFSVKKTNADWKNELFGKAIIDAAKELGVDVEHPGIIWPVEDGDTKNRTFKFNPYVQDCWTVSTSSLIPPRLFIEESDDIVLWDERKDLPIAVGDNASIFFKVSTNVGKDTVYASLQSVTV